MTQNPLRSTGALLATPPMEMWSFSRREHSDPDSSTLSRSPWSMMVLSQHRHTHFMLHAAKGSAPGETRVPGPGRTAGASPPLPSPSHQGPCEQWCLGTWEPC